MKIQELAIPHADICDELKLYFNGDNFSVTDNTIVIDTMVMLILIHTLIHFQSESG